MNAPAYIPGQVRDPSIKTSVRRDTLFVEPHLSAESMQIAWRICRSMEAKKKNESLAEVRKFLQGFKPVGAGPKQAYHIPTGEFIDLK